jgi:hypothetical protein
VLTLDPNALPKGIDQLHKIVVELCERLKHETSEKDKFRSLLRELLDAERNRKSEQLRIPAKANTDSGGNANGIPGRRRTVLGAQRRWHFDCARSVRHRQVKLIRSEAEVAGPLAKKGVRGKDGTSCPRLGTQ